MIKSKILRNYNFFGSQLETRGENLPLKIFQRHVVNPIVRRRFGRSVVPYGTLDVVPKRRGTGRDVPDTVGEAQKGQTGGTFGRPEHEPHGDDRAAWK